MVRTLALGADLCNSARGMMFALGCIQARRCNTNSCPVGIHHACSLAQPGTRRSGQGQPRGTLPWRHDRKLYRIDRFHRLRRSRGDWPATRLAAARRREHSSAAPGLRVPSGRLPLIDRFGAGKVGRPVGTRRREQVLTALPVRSKGLHDNLADPSKCLLSIFGGSRPLGGLRPFG